MRRPFQLIIVLTSIALTGCGFHLRSNHTAVSAHLPAVTFTCDPSQMLQRNVSQALVAAHVQLSDTQETPFILDVGTEEWEYKVLAYGSDGRPVRERIRLRAHFKLLAKADISTPLIEDNVTIVRERQLNPRLILADEQEKATLKNEMRIDASQQLLYQLSAFNW